MTEPIISITNLGKRYRLGATIRHDTLRDKLTDAVKKLLRPGESERKVASSNEFWALRNISFDVHEGEIIGIIGRNGAGKSTLLKLLSQITAPTEGEVRMRGRIASLLEVGTGFHPELSGRENIFLNGAIMGMTRMEIKRKLDEIIAFAEVDRFLDTPVKRYSSGMYVRLAFAVAAHLEPEILIIDEVLAVGDFQFQKKCLGKMQNVAGQGRTVLFVSHNMAAVQGLCRKAIWLDSGGIVESGPTGQVVSNYLRKALTTQTERVWSNPKDAPVQEFIRLQRVCVRPVHGSSGDPMTIRTALIFEFDYWNLKPNAHLNLSMHLFNEDGILILNTISVMNTVPMSAGLHHSECYIPGDLLNDGAFRITLMVVEDSRRVVFKYDDLLAFEVADCVERRGAWHGRWEGIVRPNLVWRNEIITTQIDGTTSSVQVHG